ncbi:MAG: hypothetical protein MI919_09610 [Holophagales bacterium]|nr:hypothetical protein [Holophagales bacterium]
MQPRTKLFRGSAERPLAASLACALLLLGLAPLLHHHEPTPAEETEACHDSHQAAPHVESLIRERHEPCGLCVKISSPGSFDRPATTGIDVLADGGLGEIADRLPHAPPGRYGASRAPPAA